jgi:hypothetical protein
MKNLIIAGLVSICMAITGGFKGCEKMFANHDQNVPKPPPETMRLGGVPVMPPDDTQGSTSQEEELNESGSQDETVVKK